MFRSRPSCNYFVYTFSFFVFCRTWKLCFCWHTVFVCSSPPYWTSPVNILFCAALFLPPPPRCRLFIQPLSVWSFSFSSRLLSISTLVRTLSFPLATPPNSSVFLSHLNILAEVIHDHFSDAKVVCRLLVRSAMRHLQKATLDRNLPFSVVPMKTSISAILFACQPPSYLYRHRKN